jgi:hypothetical protein
MRRLLLELRLALATPSRNPRMAVLLGRLLGSAFLICFATGIYSHFLQDPLPWMLLPTRPTALYQLSQGVHVTAGIACFPLLLGKLYVVFPRLFQTPPIKNFAGLLERASIALFVASSLVQITTGLLNTYQWYPFPFPFRQTHFALSFVIIGSLATHIAIKLPVIARHWTRARSLESEAGPDDRALTREDVTAELRATTPEPVGPISRRVDGVTGRVFEWIDSVPPRSETRRDVEVSRRGFLATIGIATGGVVAFTAGQSFRVLDGVNLFAPRKAFIGPQRLPINRTAAAAKVTAATTGADWLLSVRRGDTVRSFSRSELLEMPQVRVTLPIACVEGWSQLASWRGVRIRDLLELVGIRPDEDVRVTSLEVRGAYRVVSMGHEYVQDDLTLVALELNGDTLDLDHGYPARVIAPGRPGVLQTKWLSSLEVIQ